MACGGAGSPAEAERTALAVRALHIFSDETLEVTSFAALAFKVGEHVSFCLSVHHDGERFQMSLVVASLSISARHGSPSQSANEHRCDPDAEISCGCACTQKSQVPKPVVEDHPQDDEWQRDQDSAKKQKKICL